MPARSSRCRLAIILACAIGLLAPTSVSALTLGGTLRGSGFPAGECDFAKPGTGHLYFQQSVSTVGVPSYIAPTDGAITSWRTEQFGVGQPGASIALVVIRQEVTGFSVVAVDFRTLPGTIPNGDIVFTPATPIPIAAGDRIGLYGPDDKAGCDFSGTQSSGDVMRLAEFPSAPTVGAPVVPISHESTFHRVDVAAEMTATGGGGGGPAPLTPPIDLELPSIGPDGKPKTTTKGPNIQVDVAQRIFCPPLTLTCSVTTTAKAIQPTVKASTTSSSKRGRAIVVGSRKFTVAPGKYGDVFFNLNGQGKKMLKERGGKLPITVKTEVRQGSAKPVVATRSITVKAKVGQKKRK